MIATLAALALATLAAVTVPQDAGHLSRYELNPTKHTLRARLDMGHITRQQIDDAKVYVAALSCDDIGQTGVMTVTGPGMAEYAGMPYLVFDCAGADAYEWMRYGNILFEVDYWTAAALLGDGGGWGEVTR